MKKLFVRGFIALTLLTGMVMVPQQADAKRTPIEVVQDNMYSRRAYTEFGYYWWVYLKDGTLLVSGYTDTSGRTKSFIWSD